MAGKKGKGRIPAGGGVNKTAKGKGTAKNPGGSGHIPVGVGKSGPPTVTKTGRGKSGQKA